MAFAIGLNLDWGQISPTYGIESIDAGTGAPRATFTRSGKVVRRGRSVGFVGGMLCDAEGQLLAAAHRPPILLR